MFSASSKLKPFSDHELLEMRVRKGGTDVPESEWLESFDDSGARLLIRCLSHEETYRRPVRKQIFVTFPGLTNESSDERVSVMRPFVASFISWKKLSGTEDLRELTDFRFVAPPCFFFIKRHGSG